MPHDLDPTSLRLFVAVCDEGNIARAAEREAIVASAVSKRIAALEAALGAPLLVRGRRGIEPTAAGQALLRRGREWLAAMERIQAELSDFATGLQGSVHVVAAPSVLAEVLPEDIGRFMAAHPGVRVSLDERVSPEIVRAVREGGADLGVLWDATEAPGLRAQAWRSDRLCLAMRADHALADRRRIAFAEALPHVSVGVAPGGMMDTMLRRQAALLGQPLAYRISVSGMDTAARTVAAGLGAAVLPREAVQSQQGSYGLKLVPLSDAWALRRFVLLSRGDGSLTAAARALLGHLGQAARSGAAAEDPGTPEPAPSLSA
jgi:DNA-binding transcriptional LysR family regulator